MILSFFRRRSAADQPVPCLPLRRPLREVARCGMGIVLTFAFHVVLAEFIVPARVAEVNDAFASLQTDEAHLATFTQNYARDRGRTLPLTPPISLLNNPAAAFKVLDHVAAIESDVRVFNQAVTEAPDDAWTTIRTKAGVDQRLVGTSVATKFYGLEQFIACTIVMSAILVLSGLSAEIRGERQHLHFGDDVLSRDFRITPQLAAERGRELEGTQCAPSQGAVSTVSESKSSAVLDADAAAASLPDRSQVWAYPLLICKLLRLFSRSGDLSAVQTQQAQEVESAAVAIARRLSVVEYAVWAAPTLAFLGTLRGMSEGLSKANSPENLTEIVGWLGLSFDSTIIALYALLPLMFAAKVLHRRLEGLALSMKDGSDALVARLQVVAEAADNSANSQLAKLQKELAELQEQRLRDLAELRTKEQQEQLAKEQSAQRHEQLQRKLKSKLRKLHVKLLRNQSRQTSVVLESFLTNAMKPLARRADSNAVRGPNGSEHDPDAVSTASDRSADQEGALHDEQILDADHHQRTRRPPK